MKRLTLTITVLALLAAACGGGDVGTAGPVTLAPSDEAASTTTISGGETPVATTQPPAGGEPGDQADQADQVFVELFFVKTGLSAESVTRAVDAPAVAANAIRALIEGPSSAEQDAELSTAVPADTLLLGLTIANGVATIDLSREFEGAAGGSFNILSRLAQVVYTLTQFPTVNEVLFHLDGEPVEVFSGEGVVLEDPFRRHDFATILPIDLAPGTAGQPWSQDDLPTVTGAAATRLGRVALVADDDVLNVRQGPGVGSAIVGMLIPGAIVQRTGLEEIVGSSVWAQIATPIGDYWVNDRFLAAVVTPAEFEDDPRVGALLDDFVDIAVTAGDLRLVTSRRGLYVSHHGAPVRFAPDELGTILTNPTTYQWPSNAIGPDDPDLALIPARTFAEAVADSFASAFDDPDTITTVNDPIAAGNGRLPEDAIPYVFESFNYIGVHDSGDDPAYDGLDWVTWYVSIDYEGGSPVIVGLTIDTWSP